jgi:hypothetical protein
MAYTDIVGEPTDAMKELAQRLVTLEAVNDLGSNAEVKAAIQVIDKLRTLLIRFAGSAGFLALMRRAVTLSGLKDSAPASHTIEGDRLVAWLEGMSSTCILTLTAHLLDLMAMFIGQALTLTLLGRVWPIGEQRSSGD